MAHTKFSYVKKFEIDDTLLPNCWIVARIDGRGNKNNSNNTIIYGFVHHIVHAIIVDFFSMQYACPCYEIVLTVCKWSWISGI